MVIFVSLRMTASAEAPSSPILLLRRLQARGVEGVRCESQYVNGALTQRQTLWGGGALERGHSAPLEPLTQLVDALSGVGADSPVVEAAELVVGQAAKGTRSVNGR